MELHSLAALAVSLVLFVWIGLRAARGASGRASSCVAVGPSQSRNRRVQTVCSRSLACGWRAISARLRAILSAAARCGVRA